MSPSDDEHPRRPAERRDPQGPAPSITETVIASLDDERRRLTRWTRLVMLGEAVALAVLGALSGWGLIHTDTATVVTWGFRLGITAAFAFLIAAVAIVVSWPWPYAALRRVALTIAIVFTVFFVVGAAYYPGDGTMWQTNPATAFLFAGVAIAGFAEFVLLDSENFDPDPGSTP